MKKALLFFLIFSFAREGLAEKKDFKGLFGSYRREKYTENEGNDTDYGFDLLLSTLLPMSSMVKSIQSTNGAPGDLSYSTFFNFEASFFVTLSYNWELSLNAAYYTYDTRKEDDITIQNLPQTPIFHQFNMTAYPVVLAVKYRLSRQDIVPYIGAGVGWAYVKRTGSYDNDPGGNFTTSDSRNALTAQATVGVEFYFSSRAGIRLEASGQYFALPETTHQVESSLFDKPTLVFQGNPWGIRYASGLFMFF